MSAAFIGLSLGLLGAGGSILTVPILAYGVGFTEKEAILGGLFIVATISASTVILNVGKGRIQRSAVIWLSLTGVLGSSLAVQLSQYISGNTQFLLLSSIMFLAAWRMLNSPSINIKQSSSGRLKLLFTGSALGAVTGLVGVGGGFLIIPALVAVLKVPMKQAVSTSLAIIFINSAAGFCGHLVSNQALIENLNWMVIFSFSAIGILGSMIGQRLANNLPQQALKKGFAFIILTFATGIFGHSLYLLSS